ncbi:hypothetical protein [Gordonibacter sp. An230]|uniref:hypothetical protein n=1 Tax=Gordonibacter sp. An230 TaxID=1965592 RepID=UPI0013A6641E|nr:hypothetical protein [Gordonibacter sp. An230]
MEASPARSVMREYISPHAIFSRPMAMPPALAPAPWRMALCVSVPVAMRADPMIASDSAIPRYKRESMVFARRRDIASAMESPTTQAISVIPFAPPKAAGSARIPSF